MAKIPNNKMAINEELLSPKIFSDVIAKNAIAELNIPRGRFGEISEFKFKIFKYSQLPTITKNKYNPNSDKG